MPIFKPATPEELERRGLGEKAPEPAVQAPKPRKNSKSTKQ